MGLILGGLLLLVAVFALGLGFRRMVGAFGCGCHRCGTKMKAFRSLLMEDRQDILSYFMSYENREPDTSAIYVCEPCGVVYDDFSGEARSMDGDDRSICKICNTPFVWYMGLLTGPEMVAFRDANERLIEGAECLRCERNPADIWGCITCDTNMKVMGCTRCQTLYSWMSIYGSKFRYLVPLTDKSVIKKGQDPTWGHV
jgi:hypothetical protein